MSRVSVIIPTHNRASMLCSTVASAREAGHDVEVVVVDDASTDDTASLCRNMPGIIYVRLDRNVGVTRARNIGVARSTGEYLAFLDDDDRRLPGSIDKQIGVFADYRELGLVYGQVLIGDQTCTPTGEIRPGLCPTGDVFWDLLRGNMIYTSTALVKKQHFETVGLFDSSFRVMEDWDAWIRMAAAFSIGAVHEPVSIYRDYSSLSGQLSSNRPKMCRWSARALAKALRSPRGLAADAAKRHEIWTSYMDLTWTSLLKEGRSAIAEGRILYAAQNYVAAVRLDPRRAARPRAIANFVRSLRTHASA